MRSQIIIHEDATIVREDISETEILKGIYEHTDRQIKVLNDSIMKLNARLNEYDNNVIPVKSVAQELFAQHPQITNISLTRGSSIDVMSSSESDQVVVFITSDEPVSQELHDQIGRWLKVRLHNDNVLVIEAEQHKGDVSESQD